MSTLYWTDEKMALGHEAMDQTHRETVDLINSVVEADKAAFPAAFARLVRHTQEHFAFERELMEQSQDPARQEHEHQHIKLLGELAALESRVNRGQITLARAFVAERLPEWLLSHAASMDAMLAAHLKARED